MIVLMILLYSSVVYDGTVIRNYNHFMLMYADVLVWKI